MFLFGGRWRRPCSNTFPTSEKTDLKNTLPFFLIDSTIDPGDEERIAYAQDVFISHTILRKPSFLCDGPIEAKEGKCEVCQAPTWDTPHPSNEDLLPFSSSLEVLPDLMHDILRRWSLPDLRLLGHIMRYEPREVAQDIIHAYQKRHPLGMTHMAEAVKHQFPNIEPDCMRSLAPDVYFVPYRPLLRMYKTPAEYAARLVLGRVVADLQISSHTRRRISGFHFWEQWIAFDGEQVPLFTEHPEWKSGWIAAWDAYMHEMKRQDEEEEEYFNSL